MTKRENNKILMSFAIIFFALAFIFSTNAQSTSKVTDNLAIKLQQKVLLTQTQTDQIKVALNDYFNNPSEEKRKALEAKIESSLEDKQKMKYNIVKKDWWESVSKELGKQKRTNE
ncbi:MAG: hypothetical protein A2V93_06030 [Ignavibacteria bacterium RBG_16_34_14]|nr:MAG: hypothetical protein A2V93_06030 [Ignavibacteria bacterium RBG_16_34_14]